MADLLQNFLLLIGVLVAWTVGLLLLSRTAWWKRQGILALSGPILLLKTVRGREVLDRVAQRRRFWRVYGDLSIFFVFAAMVGITALLVWEATLVAGIPASRAPSPDLLLGLPGINPVIPLGYGIFALAVAIVLHELAHGVLSRVSNVRVQSLGLLLVVVPIGAFVEPDEKEMKAMPRRERLRLYAAGPATNLALASVFLVTFSFIMMPAVQPYHVGAGVTAVRPGGPADGLGIAPGWVITSLNGTAVTGSLALLDALNATLPNATVSMTACHRTECRNLAATLSYLARAPDRGGGFRGSLNITATDVRTDVFQPLGAPGGDPARGLLAYISLPFLGLMPMSAPLSDFFVVTGPWAALPDWLFWTLASGAYYMFWLNLMLGATNALPAVPLDGGYIFRDALHG
ncbi:MAG TPA: site-2 protease family protein, partial [Thermoplasmata archaeon]|nr:site-2 protease family protein [Thermoplasmata archaeon]